MGPFNSVVSSTYHAEFLTILFGLRARISNWPSGKFFTDVPNCFLSFLYIKHIQLLGGPLSNCCWSSPLRISVRAPKLAFKTNAGCTRKTLWGCCGEVFFHGWPWLAQIKPWGLSSGWVHGCLTWQEITCGHSWPLSSCELWDFRLFSPSLSLVAIRSLECKPRFRTLKDPESSY